MGDDTTRFDQLEQAFFERAVTEATAKVSSNLAGIHRRRLVTQTAAVVAIIVAVIGLGVMLFSRSQALSIDRQNAQYNCALLTEIAQVMGTGNGSLELNGHPAGFISSDAALRKAQTFDAAEIAALRPGPLKKLLQDPETARLSKASTRVDVQTTTYWADVLVPALTQLAQVNCHAHIH